MTIKKSLLFVVIQVLCCSTIQAKSMNFDQNSDMIYGRDDRYEVDDYPYSQFILKAKSVAIRISNKRLDEDRLDNSIINFPFRKLKNAIPLICPTERFVEQFSVGDCSGFLVAPNILATAGHCMKDASECSGNKWVFDFKEGTTQFSKNNVYSCKKIIVQKNIYNQDEVNDYALIELDREVEDRAPLTLRTSGRVPTNTRLVVIGHPLGLPMKITDGAKVSRMNDIEREHVLKSWLLRTNYFTANIDSYSGNSGSPVFNKKTGKVEGILIQGASDFVFNEDTQCMESLHLSNSHHNTYEKVMRITKLPQF
jgi:V8-like Glu-specific endopeptidase